MVTVCLAALLIVSMLVAGCTSNGTTTTVPAAATQAGSSAPTTAAQTETLTLTGSTTVLPIAQAVADAYMQAHPEANIQVSGGGSGVGIQAIINKKVDIGMSSADVSAAQKAQDSDMNIITIAHDGIAIVVNPANTIQDISLAQVKQIYSGNITSWSSISGAGIANSNNQIVLVGRDSSSGTRTYFDRLRNAGCQRFPDHARRQLERCSPPGSRPDTQCDWVHLHRLPHVRCQGTPDPDWQTAP